MELECASKSLIEGLVHVEVVPLLGGRLEAVQDGGILFLSSLELLEVDITIHITLCEDKEEWSLLGDRPDLCLPLVNVFEGVLIVHSDADHEDVGVLVLDLAILGKVVITASVVDLEVDLLLVDALGSRVHIKHSWLIVLSKGVMQVVGDEARFADTSITDEHELQLGNLTVAKFHLATSSSLSWSSSGRSILFGVSALGSVSTHDFSFLFIIAIDNSFR